MASTQEILSFWFGSIQENKDYLKSRGRLWFSGLPETDREIEAKFGPSVALAEEGMLDAWREEAASSLALVLLLDQFPLNIFRGQARGYHLSERAIPVALSALERGHHERMHPLMKCFFYLPLEHAEDLSLQQRSVALFRDLERETAGTFWEGWGEDSREWAERHLRVVEQFGRFPHRNEALGRPSNPAELEFLRKGVPF